MANRGDAQGAADAAAVAAANEAREQIGEDLLDNMDELEEWKDLIAGDLFPTGPSCDAAEVFAGKNKATSDSCARTAFPRQGFTVNVTMNEGVGSSLIPGTEAQKSEAKATAVLEPRCTLASPDDLEGGEIIELTCKGETVEIDPDDEDPLPDLDQLFNVRLVE